MCMSHSVLKAVDHLWVHSHLSQFERENTTMSQAPSVIFTEQKLMVMNNEYPIQLKRQGRISYWFIRIKILMFFVSSAYKVQMPITPRPYCKCVFNRAFFFYTELLILTQSDRKTWQLISSQLCIVLLVLSYARGFHAALIGDHMLCLKPCS